MKLCEGNLCSYIHPLAIPLETSQARNGDFDAEEHFRKAILDRIVSPSVGANSGQHGPPRQREFEAQSPLVPPL